MAYDGKVFHVFLYLFSTYLQKSLITYHINPSFSKLNVLYSYLVTLASYIILNAPKPQLSHHTYALSQCQKGERDALVAVKGQQYTLKINY